MPEAVRQTKVLGFTPVEIRGGEPFLQPWMPDLLTAIARYLPVIVLINGTMLTGTSIQKRVIRSKGLPLQIQISVDDPEPTRS